jgi:hypothetical protein
LHCWRLRRYAAQPRPAALRLQRPGPVPIAAARW